MKNQSELLKALREGAGLTKSQLAKGAGISSGTVSDIESGRRGFSLEMSDKLARVIAERLDLAYVAGLWDRRSVIDITKLAPHQIYNSYDTRKSPHYRTRLVFNSKHRLLVDIIHRVMSGEGSVCAVKNYERPYWSYYASCKAGRVVLDKMLPYLKLKRRQALLILELGEMQDSNRHNTSGKNVYLTCDGNPRARPLKESQLDRMEEIYQEVKRLNKAL